jgi:hypothetical protein
MRMRQITGNLPKTILPVGGIPFAFYQLKWLAQHGVTDVVGRKTHFAVPLSLSILSRVLFQISSLPKFMEELIMPFKRARTPNPREILPLAEDWGKVVARRAFGDDGPDLDLDFDTIEEVAFQAAQAVLRGTIQQALSQQVRKLGDAQPCPQCQRVCPVETEPRKLVVRGATVPYDEPKCHCPTCRRDFFLGWQNFLDQSIFKFLEVRGRVATEPPALRPHRLTSLQSAA